MKIERTKNATRNVIYGALLKAYQIIIPFLMRTAVLYFLGVQFLGLNSLFSSILQVLNLAELGVGSAMVFSMYKPIAEDDKVKVCALMKLYRIYYRVIGGVVAVTGLAILPVLPRLINGDAPEGINIYVLYLLNLSATVLSYWLFAYKNSIFQAYQRTDVVSKVQLVTNTLQYGLQFLVLVYLKDYYIYIMVTLLTQVVNNIATAICAEHMYPEYKPYGELSKDEVKKINKKIKDLFTSKLGATIVGSADTIVISAYLGLSVLAVYQNYYFIMNSVVGIVLVIFSSCTAGIGNSLVTETIDKNYFDFKKFAFLIMWIVTNCVSCFLCLYQPFMVVWIGEDYLLEMGVIVLLCAYFFVYIVNHLSAIYKDAAGIWHQDRFRPLISGLVNLGVNLLLVRFIGLYGIVLSTIISYLFVAMPWLIINLFTNVFKRSPLEYIVFLLCGALGTTIISGICYFTCSLIRIDNGFVQVFIYFIVCIVVSNLLLVLIYRHSKMFNPFCDLCNKVTRGKFKKLFDILKK